MASRKDTQQIIDFTPYIRKGKDIDKKEYPSYSKRLISLLLDDKTSKEEIYSIFGVFLSSFTSSISFDYNNNINININIFKVINMFTNYVLSDYKELAFLIKTIELFLS